jgi:trigger factor
MEYQVMLVKQEQVSPCEVELEVQIELEKIDSAWDATYKELGRDTTVPGFRKGKAPRVVLEQFLDRETVKDRVANNLIRGAYPEALEESKLEPFALADVELVKFDDGEPLVFKAKVPLSPQVEIADYKGLEVERAEPNVTEETVEAEIRGLLERHAEFIPITDRPVQTGDVINAEMKDNSKPEEAARPSRVEVGSNLPDFDKAVVGMSIDEEKVIDITYPDEFPDEELRGKTLSLQIKVLDIQEKKLPEMNDEWVKENFAPKQVEGQDPPNEIVDTVEKLRAKWKSLLEEMQRTQAESDMREKLVDMVVAKATVNFPEVMVEDAVDDRVEHLVEELKSRKLTMEAYLKHVNKSYEELRAEYAEESRLVLMRALTLREIREKENIEVTDEDFKAQIEEMAKERNVPVESMTAYVEKTQAEDTVRRNVLHKKVVDFLVNASNIKNTAR